MVSLFSASIVDCTQKVIKQIHFAVELAMIMDRLYGGVCYAGIDVDPELKYPKGILFTITPTSESLRFLYSLSIFILS